MHPHGSTNNIYKTILCYSVKILFSGRSELAALLAGGIGRRRTTGGNRPAAGSHQPAAAKKLPAAFRLRLPGAGGFPGLGCQRLKTCGNRSAVVCPRRKIAGSLSGAIRHWLLVAGRFLAGCRPGFRLAGVGGPGRKFAADVVPLHRAAVFYPFHSHPPFRPANFRLW